MAVGASTIGSPESVKLQAEQKKAFLEFARVKSLELAARQVQVSRTFTFFVLSTFILYGLVYAPLVNLNFDLSSVPVFGGFAVAQSRPPALFGMAIIAIYFFCKFGWVYHLSVKEIIDTELVLHEAKKYAEKEVNALRYQLNSNFIAQSVVTFQYPVEKNLDNELKETGQNVGSLAGRSRKYSICVNVVMILLLVLGAVIITNFQIMIMLILGNISGVLNFLVGGIFLTYYGFFLFSGLMPGAVDDYIKNGNRFNPKTMCLAYVAIVICSIFIIATTFSVFITGAKTIHVASCKVTSANLGGFVNFISFRHFLEEAPERQNVETPDPNIVPEFRDVLGGKEIRIFIPSGAGMQRSTISNCK